LSIILKVNAAATTDVTIGEKKTKRQKGFNFKL